MHNVVQLTRLLDSLLGEGLNGGGLVALGVEELVVEDLDGGVLGGEGGDHVGDGGSVGEGRDVLADTGEAEDDVLAVGTTQLGLALLADDGQVGLGLLEEELAHRPGETRVNTTAETLVGAADDNQGLLALALGGLGLGLLENGVGGLTVVAGLGHGPLGAGELGGGDDLHRLGNFLDVADRLETVLNLAQGGIGGGGGCIEGGRPRAEHAGQFLMQLAMQWQRLAGSSSSSGTGLSRTVRRRPGQPSAPDEQLVKASWARGGGIEMERRWAGGRRVLLRLRWCLREVLLLLPGLQELHLPWRLPASGNVYVSRPRPLLALEA